MDDEIYTRILMVNWTKKHCSTQEISLTTQLVHQNQYTSCFNCVRDVKRQRSLQTRPLLKRYCISSREACLFPVLSERIAPSVIGTSLSLSFKTFEILGVKERKGALELSICGTT